ncbi:MAG: hypothetical protein KG029_03785 [Bacteroidetes bacterium]|nr:hypothetical protein [Bacteroidota bacterium]
MINIILLFISLIFMVNTTFASEIKVDQPKVKFSLPPEYDFKSVIKSHYKTIEDYSKHFKADGPEDANAYGFALAKLTLGLVKNDSMSILGANYLFKVAAKESDNARERELSLFGIKYTENLLSGKGFKDESEIRPAFEQIDIKKNKPSANKFKKLIIGKSSIKITKGMKIKTQVDRVTRDWFSAYNISSSPREFNKERIVPWHEGEKIREILKLTTPNVIPVWGTVAKKFDNRWYAPDAKGVYRFRISEDKIYNYPSTIIINENTVIMNDTHGINAIAWDSLDADLVVGCGDLDGKVQAAYYLASQGVNVYMPTDRFVSMLIGTKTKGTIIGSAPVRKASDGAVIGGQPISISIDESIMVTNTTGGYPLQYYDTPYLYFREIERYIGKKLKIMPIDINEYGKADKIVWRAERAGVKVIGIRVASKEEYEAVAWFLRSDKSHRAILFHSAVYPEGYRLFFEFPAQTTFGDINIGFE